MTTTKANVNFSSHGFHKNTSMAIFHKLNSSKHWKGAKYLYNDTDVSGYT